MTTVTYHLLKNNAPELIKKIYEDYGYVESGKYYSKKDAIIEQWKDGQRDNEVMSENTDASVSYVKYVISRYIKEKYLI